MDMPLAIMPRPHTNFPIDAAALRKEIAALNEGALFTTLVETGFADFHNEDRYVMEGKLIAAIQTDRAAWEQDFGAFEGKVAKRARKVRGKGRKGRTVKARRPSKSPLEMTVGEDRESMKAAVKAAGIIPTASRDNGVISWTFTKGANSVTFTRDEIRNTLVGDLIALLK
jgi:hypothetical protein